MRQAPSKDTCLESLRRSSFSLNVATDTLYACLETPRSSACNASFPHVPVPSRAAYFPFRECLFFISSGNRVATAAKARIHSASPDRPRRSSCW